MLRALRQRFSQLLDAHDPEFDGLAAAACLLDPLVGMTLLSPDMSSLLNGAKSYLHQLYATKAWCTFLLRLLLPANNCNPII